MYSRVFFLDNRRPGYFKIPGGYMLSLNLEGFRLQYPHSHRTTTDQERSWYFQMPCPNAQVARTRK